MRWCIVVFPDITEQKKTEQALQESEERNRRILETMPDGVAIVEETGHVIYANQAFCNIYGYHIDELIGMHATQLIQPDYRSGYDTFVKAVHADKASFTSESHDLRKDGSSFIAEIQGTAIELRGQRCMMAVLRDVTQQRDAERRLRFTQFTVDQAKIAVFWCHDDGRFFYVNDTACNWLQYSRAELMEMHVADINPEFPRAGWADHWQEIKEHGVVRMESVHQRKNGEVYPVEIYSNCVQFEGKDYKLAFVHDISERRLAEEELANYRDHLEELVHQRTAELKAANNELESFAYSVSHDLRAPLRSMSGFSQAVAEDYGDRLDDTGRDYLQRIRRAAGNMGVLIDDLLNLSRVTRSTLKCRQVDVSHLARHVVENLQQHDPLRQVEVDIADGVHVYGDPGLLEVVLQNLLGNAWKFTAKAELPRIVFEVREEPGDQIYCVRDNGAGFDMAYADKLFGVFQRLHSASEFEGTGVGLATVQRIVQRHGGRIWAESTLGQGATFYFTLTGTAGTMNPLHPLFDGSLKDGS
ncbi:PAS domain S-box protein [Planctomycetota bacterium]